MLWAWINSFGEAAVSGLDSGGKHADEHIDS